MLKEFKEFIARGNVIDMAVGVIIGGAFTAIVTSLTNNLINSLLGVFLGQVDFSSLKFTIGEATFRYGSFLNSIINFLIIAFIVFLMVKGINKFFRNKKDDEVAPSSTDTLLTEIRDLLKEKDQSEKVE